MAARVPYLNREDLPEADREIFDNLTRERGNVGNIFRALAHTPNLLRRFLGLGGELRNKTALDPKLRELAIVTVGRLTDAQYEYVHHWNLARSVKFGASNSTRSPTSRNRPPSTTTSAQ